jgi:hypothetical protein
MTFVDPGALGGASARTQGFPIAEAIEKPEDTEIAPPRAAGRHNAHSVRAS